MQQLNRLTLRQNFSWTFAGNIVYAGCQWGMLVVLAKLGSPEMVGQFTLGLAVTAPIIMLTNLQLRELQATDAKHKYLFGDYLGLRLIGTVLALLIVAGIVLGTGYRWETASVILIIGLAKAFESISDVFYGLIQQHERMDRIAISMMIKGSLSLFLLGMGVYLTRSVLWGSLGLMLAWACVLFCYDIRSGALMLRTSGVGARSAIQNLLRPRWQFKTLAKLTWLALPLGFTIMLISLNTNIPRYFIQHYLGERALGIFASIAYLIVAGNMVVSALATSASPRLAKYYAEGNSGAFSTLLLKLVGIGTLLGSATVLIGIFAGHEVLSLLYTPEYAQHTDLFVWLSVAAGINYVSWFLGNGMTAARYLRIQLPMSILVTGTSTIACFYLIPISGLSGAVSALIVGAIVQFGLSLGVILHALHRLQQHQPKKFGSMTLGDKPLIRILHVVGGMNRGGIETWLMNVLRHIDRKKFQMDFLVHTNKPCAYDDEIRALGSKVIPCSYSSHPYLYARNFKEILHKYGSYDIVHSHVHHFSGFVLRLAKQTNVPVRIAHSHRGRLPNEAKAGLKRRFYIALMKRWIAHNSTFSLACSQHAAADLFGSLWKSNPRCKVVYCGINLSPFKDEVNFNIRQELGTPENAFIIGHVGRFEQEKNHAFVLEIFAELAKQEPKARLLLVGDGTLRPSIERMVVQLGLTERVIFTGSRSDVPHLMLGAIDVFLLPSFYEGLGLVLIEAQAAGLPCVCSDVIPEEADVIKALIHRVSLSQPASAWAKAILAAREAEPKITQADALTRIEQSSFNIQMSVQNLSELYLEQLRSSSPAIIV